MIPNGSIPRPSRWVARASIGYLVTAIAIWVALHFGADDWSIPTLLLFGPRWVIALPLVILTMLAGYYRSWFAAVTTFVAAIIVAGPITGGTLDVGGQFRLERPALMQLRIVTWNMAGKKPGSEFKQFYEQTSPDVIAIQESGLTAEEVPAGWKFLGDGGNRIATRLPARMDSSFDLFPVTGVGGRLNRFVLETPDVEVTLIVVHLPTVRPGVEAALRSKLSELGELRHIIGVRSDASHRARTWVGPERNNVIVAGDFNMPVESRIYRTDWADFRNAFSEVGMGWGATKQTRWFGIRIDHVLYSSPWECRRAWMGPAMGSDHRPVVADLVFRED